MANKRISGAALADDVIVEERVAFEPTADTPDFNGVNPTLFFDTTDDTLKIQTEIGNVYPLQGGTATAVTQSFSNASNGSFGESTSVNAWTYAMQIPFMGTGAPWGNFVSLDLAATATSDGLASFRVVNSTGTTLATLLNQGVGFGAPTVVSIPFASFSSLSSGTENWTIQFQSETAPSPTFTLVAASIVY